MKNSPLAALKERFGEDRKAAKLKLVEAVKKAGSDLWTDRVNEEKGLEHVSNAKLLRLERAFESIKKEVGKRSQLIDKLVDLEKKTKDSDYRVYLEKQATLRLWDRYKTLRQKSA